MNTTVKRTLTKDDIILENAIAARARLRVIGGIFLIFAGALFVTAAFFPLLAKSALPVLWVEFANNNGWNDQMQEIGMLLLANGRIEIYPLWVSYVGMTLGAVLAWLGTSIISSRKDPRVFGRTFTKGYWLQFYAIRPPKGRTKVNYRPLKKSTTSNKKE